MTYSVGSVRRSVEGNFLPSGAEDVPHVKHIADNVDEAVADQTWFEQRGGKYRPFTYALESQSVVPADRKADGGFNRHRNTPAPSGGITVHIITMTQYIHREDPVFVEAPETSKRDHGMIGHANRLFHILEYQGRRRLREFLQPKTALNSLRREYFAQFFPRKHDYTHS